MYLILLAWRAHSHYPIFETLVHLRQVGPHYNRFNMIFSDGERLGVFESVRGGGRELGPGIGGAA